jgi:hypothetical protein
VSVGAGTLGAAYLAQPSPATRRWAGRVAAVGGSAAVAAALGLVVFDVF